MKAKPVIPSTTAPDSACKLSSFEIPAPENGHNAILHRANSNSSAEWPAPSLHAFSDSAPNHQVATTHVPVLLTTSLGIFMTSHYSD